MERPFNIRYLRTCIRQQLAGKPYYGNQPFKAEFAGTDIMGVPMVKITDTETGDSTRVYNNARGHRIAILQLLGEDLDYPRNYVYRSSDYE